MQSIFYTTPLHNKSNIICELFVYIGTILCNDVTAKFV